MTELKEGEKYLTIDIEILGEHFKVPAFENKEKTKDNHPDFKGKNVAVWISTKKKKLDPIAMLK